MKSIIKIRNLKKNIQEAHDNNWNRLKLQKKTTKTFYFKNVNMT